MRGTEVAVITVRFPSRGPVAPGTQVELPAGEWTSVFGGRATAGGTVDLAELLGDTPVTVLEVDR